VIHREENGVNSAGFLPGNPDLTLPGRNINLPHWKGISEKIRPIFFIWESPPDRGN
jgi:hypothetical protein